MTTQTINIKHYEAAISSLQNENSYLKEQVEWFQRQLFGQRSEKIVSNLDEKQLVFSGFENPENTSPENKDLVKAHERKKTKKDGEYKITLPPDLPVETIILDLSEEEKVCHISQKSLIKIGEEVTHKLAHKPGSFFIKEIIRPKYALPKESGEGIRVQNLPETLLERCQADDSFLADILCKKFADHMPLYRISEILSRDGIGISRQQLSQWVLRCGQALSPLYHEMKKIILESGNVFIDESPVNLLVKGKDKVQKAYMWVLVGGLGSNPPHRIYGFYPDRKHANAKDILGDYAGMLHSDKYGAYEALAIEKNSKIIWCPCWVHIRRNFFDAESGDPKLRKWILRKIRYLFMLERVAWARSEEDRLKIRQEIEIPIIDELIKVIKARLVQGRILPKSKFRQALGYFCGLIPYLKNYTQHAYARLDNNVAERAVRPLAIGRKNWLFMGSEKGGEAAAVILSLVQSCRGLGINPREYLADIMPKLMGYNAKNLHELLPDEWIKSK